MIVGGGRAPELDRCLKSVMGTTLFDDVVITVTQPDPEIESVVKKWGCRIFHFAWCDDFSAARNFSLSHLKTDWWMWLDSDDVIKEDEIPKYTELKRLLPSIESEGVDVVQLMYNYGHDEQGNPTNVHPRERIMRRTPKYKWIYPIHEVVDTRSAPKRKTFQNIAVDHYRTGKFDLERNLRILRKHAGISGDMRMRFYLAKDLCESEQWDEGIPIAQSLLETKTTLGDEAAVLCRIIMFYFWNGGKLLDAVKYARLGISNSPRFAEFWCILADHAQKEKQQELAVKYFQMALGCRFENTQGGWDDYYMSIPCRNLYLENFFKGDFVLSLVYNKLLLDHKDTNPAHFDDREVIWKSLQSFVDSVVSGEQVSPSPMQEISSQPIKSSTPIIGWLIPHIDLDNPSIRVRRVNVHNELVDQGVDSFVVSDYYNQPVNKTVIDLRNANIVVVTQFSEYDLQLMMALKAKGVRLIYDHCEAIFGFPFEHECMAAADIICCCSNELRRVTQEKESTQCVTIRDSYEVGGMPAVIDAKNKMKPPRSKPKPKAVFMGMGGNSFLANDVLRDAVEAAGYELVVISEWDNATMKWTRETWLKDFLACDVCLCPQREGIQDAKSNIKVTTAMALGMPVIASPIPSYTEIIKDGENGFLCSVYKPEEWTRALVALKKPEMRYKVGRAGLESVRELFAIQNIATGWTLLAKDLLASGEKAIARLPSVPTPIQESVDIIIQSYNNLEYLKLTVSSILMNTDGHPYQLIISDAGSDADVWEYLRSLKGITVIGAPGLRRNYSEVTNAGISAGRSKYIVVMNNDVIVSRGWLKNCLQKMEKVDRLAICGCLSNCDEGWLFNVAGRPTVDLNVAPNFRIHPAMKREKVVPHLSELYAFMEKSNKSHAGEFHVQDWVAGYFYVIARVALDEVGLFDDAYKNGCEDLDLCRRLSLAGYVLGQAWDAFVFHFGGISRGAYEKEPASQKKDGKQTAYQIEDRRNHEIYRQKWAKKKIGIYTGPGWEKWDREKVDAGMGGSETWAAELAAEFSRRGFLVQIFGDPELEYIDRDGVIYRDHRKMIDILATDRLDAFITSRTCDPLAMPIHSAQNFVMIHDVFLSPNPAYERHDWKVKKYAYLSEWHKDFLIKHHGIDPAKMFLTGHGLNQSLYAKVKGKPIVKKNMAVYSSSPDRGLRELLKMMPKIRKSVPDFTLIVAYGFENWEKAAKHRNQIEELADMAEVKRLLKTTKGVKYVGRIRKKELAKYQMQAKVWLYPTWFQETFCITAIENGFAGNACIIKPIAGLKTTLGNGSAIGVSGDVYSKEYADIFVKETVKMLKNVKHRKQFAEAAKANAERYTWKAVADEWLKQFNW